VALLPPTFLDTVVAIGVGDDPERRRWLATGFIYGEFQKKIAQSNQKQYQLWLITNKHVLEDLKEVYIKFNSAATADSKDYGFHL